MCAEKKKKKVQLEKGQCCQSTVENLSTTVHVCSRNACTSVGVCNTCVLLEVGAFQYHPSPEDFKAKMDGALSRWSGGDLELDVL